MKGYIKITAEINGELQAVGAEADIRMCSNVEDRAMLVNTFCRAINIDPGDRRTMRKLLRAMRRLKTANPPAQPEGDAAVGRRGDEET
jgi:hypothetical protein